MMNQIVTTKELYLAYEGKCQLYFPAGSEGQLLNIADMILEGSRRGLPTTIQKVIDECRSTGKKAAFVEGQVIAIDADDYEKK